MEITITVETTNQAKVLEAIAFLNTLVTKDAHSEPETKVEEPKKEKTTPSKATAKKEPEASPTQTTEKVTLDVLKNEAKNAVGRTSREKVKETIGEFATKLAEVKADDYSTLHAKLKAL